MPYKLRKAPGQQAFWVVAEDGKHMSKEPLPKERAKAQLRALYAAEGREGKGRVDDISNAIKSAYNGDVERVEGLTGGANGEVVSATDLLEMCKYTYAYIKGEVPQPVGNWALVEQNWELLLYGNGKGEFILAVRGTKEFRDVLAWKPVMDNKLKESSRAMSDETTLKQWKAARPGIWYGTGHSLGGALCDLYREAGYVGECLTFNPVIEPRMAGKPGNKRVYFQGDPLLLLFGGLDPNKIVVVDKSPGWIASLFGLDFDAHGLANFDGQLDDVKLGGAKPIDLEAMFAVLEGGSYVPRDLYLTAENQLSNGDPRPPAQRRELRDVELGLRAIAHLDERTNPLAAFGARVMADDLYEYQTGEKVDWGHDEAAKNALKVAFRNTRPEQVDKKRAVDAMMAKYNLKGREGRATAYRYLTGEEEPPRAPEKKQNVKTPAQIRAEMEAEVKRKEEEETAAEARRIAEAEERKRLAEEIRRKGIEEEMARLKEEEEAKARRAEEEKARAKVKAEEEAAQKKMAEALKEKEKVLKSKPKKEKGKKAKEEVDDFEMELANQAIVNAILEKKKPIETQLFWSKSNLHHFQMELKEFKEKLALFRKDKTATLGTRILVMDGAREYVLDVGYTELVEILSALDSGEQVTLAANNKISGAPFALKVTREKDPIVGPLRRAKDRMDTHAEERLAKLEAKEETEIASLERKIKEMEAEVKEAEAGLKAVEAEAKAKEAEFAAGRKGKGKQSVLARALGHASVSKKRLDELRQKRADALARGEQELARYWNEQIQKVAKPNIQAQLDFLADKFHGYGAPKGRKPYVGKAMKEKFLKAAEGKADTRNLLNKAKRLYKEGGVSWEEVIRRVLG